MSQSLSPEQLAVVREWVASGTGLSDVQKQIGTEFGLSMTYLEARLLMTELQVTPVTIRTQETPSLPPADVPGSEDSEDVEGDVSGLDESPGDAGEAPAESKLQISVDELVSPGTLISGKALFSDGKTAVWYIDEMGRLGLGGVEKGYRPPEQDLPIFQKELAAIMRRAGF